MIKHTRIKLLISPKETFEIHVSRDRIVVILFFEPRELWTRNDG